MIPFKNQEKILNTLTSELCSLNYPKSWNIVIPPCFYTGHFVSALHERIQQTLLPAMRVSHIPADTVHSPEDLVKEIYYGWTGKVLKNRKSSDTPPNILLAELLNAVGNKQNILIISEFHKILGKMDERILVALRLAEQAGRINTIAIAIYPHKWLRDKWKKEGHLLNVSNYGDHHYCLNVESYNFTDLKKLLSKKDIPDDLIEMLYEWTGGIPECMDRVLEEWIGSGRPNLDPKIVDLLRHKACDSLERFAKFIDLDGSRRFSKFIINITQHDKEAESFNQLSRFHPWAKIILNEDGLRINALSDTITQLQMEEAFQQGKIGESVSDIAEFAIYYYQLGKYDLAIQVIQKYRPIYDVARLRLIELHSRIMSSLLGGVSMSPCPGVDTEWGSLIGAIAEARIVLSKVIKEEEELFREIIYERYNDLEKLAKCVNKANKSGVRYLDQLGGLYSEQPDRDLSFTLAVFQFESGRSIPGNTAACKAVIELPEQIIRLWGFWKYGINYYSFPDNGSKVWAKMVDLLSTRLSPINGMPTHGRKFPSFRIYYYYLFALEQCMNVDFPTWQTKNILDEELSMLDMRNDIVHATVYINKKNRKKLYDFIDVWLTRLERDCMGTIDRATAMSKVEPLKIF